MLVFQTEAYPESLSLRTVPESRSARRISSPTLFTFSSRLDVLPARRYLLTPSSSALRLFLHRPSPIDTDTDFAGTILLRNVLGLVCVCVCVHGHDHDGNALANDEPAAFPAQAEEKKKKNSRSERLQDGGVGTHYFFLFLAGVQQVPVLVVRVAVLTPRRSCGGCKSKSRGAEDSAMMCAEEEGWFSSGLPQTLEPSVIMHLHYAFDLEDYNIFRDFRC